ncbi:MAG: endonuclease MutS2 [Clostridia bacterium]|nr:endonuclease MutS2 [Clostridia bacterium]
MSFRDKTLSTLEFDKIRVRLTEIAATDGAKAAASKLCPSDDAVEIRRRLTRTTDARRLAMIKGMPPFSGVTDVGNSLERAVKGASLSARELLDVASLLTCTRALIDYREGEMGLETVLDEVFERLIPNRTLEEKITRAIIAEDIIADEASPMLSDIRRKIRNVNSKIKDVLAKYTGGAYGKYLQENIVTTRDGRYVVPVKVEYRGEVKGLVHDTSASGATVFIEPMAVVDANNELRELQSKETHEIERILAEFSAAVADTADTIERNYYNITDLALVFACAALSIEMDASEPEITEDRKVSLRAARHPLLDKKKVVPITVSLGGSYDTLVITGPNTGGKTVTLKTIGLLCLMAQAGLHIPAEPGSSVCVFDAVFSDIGDEQNIEQSLSTFSAHMVGIVSVIREMTPDSLVLFDELGAGTDPVEGAALAMSILEEVRRVGCLCAATTHYAELKAYALETEGVTNASCEFDVETLRPTYRLIIGTPGKSNAFAISEKLGLPEKIVARASQFVETGARDFEAVIAKLEETRLQLQNEREEAERLRREYEEFKTKAEKKLRQKIGTAEKDAERMRAQAEQMLLSAKATSNFIYDQLEKLKKEKDAADLAAKMAQTKKDIRARINDYESRVYDPQDDTEDEDYVLPRPLKKGDRVKHRNLGTIGVLVDDPDKKGNVSVRMGQVKTRANVKDLRLIADAETAEARDRKNQKQYRAVVSREFKPELDVRGQIGDDAWFMVDKYLDEANVAGIHSVTVIHGKGTGALRAAIWARLKNDKRVTSFRAGAYGEGDYGVTVIELK